MTLNSTTYKTFKGGFFSASKSQNVPQILIAAVLESTEEKGVAGSICDGFFQSLK